MRLSFVSWSLVSYALLVLLNAQGSSGRKIITLGNGKDNKKEDSIDLHQGFIISHGSHGPCPKCFLHPKRSQTRQKNAHILLKK
ncbi:hypothetical protein ACFX2G_035131 [Malus domestica]